MGDATARGDGITRLLDRLERIEARIRTLQMFDGTQNTRAIEKLQQLVADLPGQITTAIGMLLTTAALHVAGNAQIDGTSTTNGSAGVGGNLSVGGTAGIGGVLTANAGVASTDAKTRVLVSGWSSLWIDPAGRMGQSPSSRRFKQDIEQVDLDVDAILSLTPVQFRLIVAVAELGDDARIEVGLIAEDLEPIAPWAVFYDADGLVQGINYDRLVVALLAVLKRHHTQLLNHEDRLAALEAR